MEVIIFELTVNFNVNCKFQNIVNIKVNCVPVQYE